MAPWILGPFGPPKVLVLFACAACVAGGLALDAELLHTLIGRLRVSKVAWAAGALWLIVLLSAALSVDPLRSLIGSYGDYAGLLSFLAATVIGLGAAALPWEEQWPRVARAVSIALVIASAYGLAQVAGLDFVAIDAGSNLERLRSTLGNSSNMGVWALLAVPLAAERVLRDRLLAWRVTAGAGCVLALPVVLMTQSRGAWAGALAAVVVAVGLLLLRRGDRRTTLRAIGAAVAVVALAAAGIALVPALRERLNPARNATIVWRLGVWGATTRMVADRPLLGWGPGSFRYVYPTYRPPRLEPREWPEGVTADAHNLVLSVAASAGVPGALALLTLAVAIGGACLAAVRRGSHGWPVLLTGTVALAGGFTALQFHFLTSDTLPAIALLGGFVVAFAPASADGRAGAGARGVVAVVGLMLACVAVAAAGALEADRLRLGVLERQSSGASWSEVAGDLKRAAALAPWEPAFEQTIGKVATQALPHGGDAAIAAQGETAFDAARRVSPLDDEIVNDLGLLLLRQGLLASDRTRSERALDLFAGLTERDPNNAGRWAARAQAAAALGDLESARADLSKALELAPGSTEFRKMLDAVENLKKGTE